MAVYHCRCAFLWFFLLHKQKKEQKERTFFLLFFVFRPPGVLPGSNHNINEDTNRDHTRGLAVTVLLNIISYRRRPPLSVVFPRCRYCSFFQIKTLDLLCDVQWEKSLTNLKPLLFQSYQNLILTVWYDFSSLSVCKHNQPQK